MIKIWARTIIDKRTALNEVFCFDGKYDENEFDSYVRFICHELDIPTPIVLSSHIKGFTQFNISQFKTRDFVESIDFDELVLEHCPV